MKVIKGGRVSELLQDTKIPKMFHARQTFPREIIRPEEIPAAVHREMEKEDIGSRIRPGMSIAVTAGYCSRLCWWV